MRTMEEVVEEVRSFPLADRLRIVERIVHEIADSAASKREASPPRAKISPVGWLADDPELADQLEKLTTEARTRGRARGFDDESSD